MGTDEQHTYRIGVVEDHAVAVAGLRQILSADPSLVIVAAAATVADLLADTTDLDLAILDLRLPDGSSPITNVEQLRNEGIETLVFTSGDEPFLVRAAARAGVLGVVRRSPSVTRSSRRRSGTRRRAGWCRPSTGRQPSTPMATSRR